MEKKTRKTSTKKTVKKAEKKKVKKWEYMAVIEDLNRRSHTCLFTCSYRLDSKDNIRKNIDEWKVIFNGNFQAMTFFKELREVEEYEI